MDMETYAEMERRFEENMMKRYAELEAKCERKKPITMYEGVKRTPVGPELHEPNNQGTISSMAAEIAAIQATAHDRLYAILILIAAAKGIKEVPDKNALSPLPKGAAPILHHSLEASRIVDMGIEHIYNELRDLL